VIGAWLLYGETPGRPLLDRVLADAAAWSASSARDVVIHRSSARGDLYALLGALFYGVYMLYVQRARTGMDTLTFITWAVCAVRSACCRCVSRPAAAWGFDMRRGPR